MSHQHCLALLQQLLDTVDHRREIGILLGHARERIPIDRPFAGHRARQPREVFDEDAMAELVHSIREVGLLQPIVVRPAGPESFELIMGERRWRAAGAAGSPWTGMRTTLP